MVLAAHADITNVSKRRMTTFLIGFPSEFLCVKFAPTLLPLLRRLTELGIEVCDDGATIVGRNSETDLGHLVQHLIPLFGRSLDGNRPLERVARRALRLDQFLAGSRR